VSYGFCLELRSEPVGECLKLTSESGKPTHRLVSSALGNCDEDFLRAMSAPATSGGRSCICLYRGLRGCRRVQAPNPPRRTSSHPGPD
jgi:hypothetical protein